MADEREHEPTAERPAVEAPFDTPSAPMAHAAPWLADAPAGLDHRTASAARASVVLGAQRAHGNAWVARALAQRQEATDQPQAPTALLVDDGQDAQPGQLTRGAFVATLRPAVVAEAKAAVKNPLLALSVEPAVDAWLAGYAGKDAAAIERAIRAELPGAAAVTSAAQLVPMICAQVRLSVQEREATEADSSAPAPSVGGTLAAVAGLLFSRRPDAPARAADPLGIRRRLGRGRPLDASVRARMEPLLGQDFADVRVHADGTGARVSGELGARALAVGRDIAFGAGEFQPGTATGDALLAHELAHVAQQSGASAAGGAAAGHEEAALERDADDAAAGAVASLHLGVHRGARPRLGSGLSLRSCKGGAPKQQKLDDEPMPANPREVYEHKLAEGIQILKAAGFGRAEVSGHYNKEYFDREIDEENSTFGTDDVSSKLVLIKGKRPSDAIDATFKNPGEWSVDCAEYVQLAELYALRHSLGATEFNRRVGTIQLTIRSHGSTLLDDLTYWNRETPNGPMRRYTLTKGKPAQGDIDPRPVEKILADAPIGARVMWTNLKAPQSHPWHNENTVKVGADLYAAHGIRAPDGRKTFTRAEVEQGMAREFLGQRGETADAAYVSANIFLKQIEIFDTAKGLPGGAPDGGAPR